MRLPLVRRLLMYSKGVEIRDNSDGLERVSLANSRAGTSLGARTLATPPNCGWPPTTWSTHHFGT